MTGVGGDTFECSPTLPGAVGSQSGSLSQVLFAERHATANLDGTRKLRCLILPWASLEKQDTDPLYPRIALPCGASVISEHNYPAPHDSAASCPAVLLQSRQVGEAGSSPQLPVSGALRI